MSEGTEGTAVVTTDQIYAELRSLGQTLLELKIRFETIEALEKRIEKLEEARGRNWQLPIAWTTAASGVFAAVYQALPPSR